MKFIENEFLPEEFNLLAKENLKKYLSEYADRYDIEKNEESILKHFVSDVENDLHLIEIEENEFTEFEKLGNTQTDRDMDIYTYLKNCVNVMQFKTFIYRNQIYIKIIYSVFGVTFINFYKKGVIK
jgi:hypothetical protein